MNNGLKQRRLFGSSQSMQTCFVSFIDSLISNETKQAKQPRSQRVFAFVKTWMHVCWKTAGKHHHLICENVMCSSFASEWVAGIKWLYLDYCNYLERGGWRWKMSALRAIRGFVKEIIIETTMSNHNTSGHFQMFDLFPITIYHSRWHEVTT